MERRRREERPQDEQCELRVVHLDRVAQARGKTLPDRELERLSQLYKALGDPTRLRILRALSVGELCVCDLAATVGLSASAVSHQLRRLREQALVKARRDGQVVYYALDDEHVGQLLDIGLAHARE